MGALEDLELGRIYVDIRLRRRSVGLTRKAPRESTEWPSLVQYCSEYRDRPRIAERVSPRDQSREGSNRKLANKREKDTRVDGSRRGGQG
jgi:hypothetical protein